VPRVLMVWNPLSPFPNSMDRYASRLSAALRAAAPDGDWAIDDLVPRGTRLARRLAGPAGVGRRADSLLSRFLVTPVRAAASRADLFHIVDHGNGHVGYALRGRPLVITCHDLVPLRAGIGSIPNSGLSAASVAKFRWIVSAVRHADAVIAISQSTRRDVVRFLGVPDDRIRVIPHGVDEHFRPLGESAAAEIGRFRHHLGIPEGAEVIIHVSNLSSYKNLPGVLRALEVVVRRFGRDVRLLRVGDRLRGAQGGLARDLWRLALDLGVAPYVHEAGHLSGPPLVTAYNAADVMLFPSWWEGLGIPPLEAMACGVPVVVSDRASLPEVAGDAGVQVAPDDYGGMAAAVVRLLDDAGWRRRRIASGLAQAARFSWARTAADTLRVYQDVLPRSRRLAQPAARAGR